MPHNSKRWAQPAQFAKRRLKDLQVIARVGLDPAYANPEEWLHDFWPDFPWDKRSCDATIKHLRANPKWPELARALEAKIGYDVDAELLRGLNYDPNTGEPT